MSIASSAASGVYYVILMCQVYSCRYEYSYVIIHCFVCTVAAVLVNSNLLERPHKAITPLLSSSRSAAMFFLKQLERRRGVSV